MWPFTSLIRDTLAESAPAEERSAINLDEVFAGSMTSAGVPVSQANSVQLPAVWRCVTLNSETPASLPVDCYAKRGKTRAPYPEPSWLIAPNDEQTWPEFIQQVQISLELDGNAFILRAYSKGKIVGLYVLAPTAVQVVRRGVTSGPIEYHVQQTNGSPRTYTAANMTHIKGFVMPQELRGLSPIAAHAVTIGAGKAAGEFGARFFGEGAQLSGIITTPGTMTKEAADRLKDDFMKKHGGISRSHAVGVLSGGAGWTPMSLKPEESQFLQTQRFTASQIAFVYGVPAEYVTDVEGAKGYVTALAQRNRLWLQTGLLMRLRRLEVAFSALLPRPAYIKFNVEGLLRADPEQRAALCTAMIQNRAMTPNEWRALEDMDPLPGGDEPLESVQFQGQAPPDDQPADSTPNEPASAGSAVKEEGQ